MQLSQPNRRVVAFVGDGSALFTYQALWTAAKYRLPVTFVIVNNLGYLAVKAAIHGYGGKASEIQSYPASDISKPKINFLDLAKGYGVSGKTVYQANELADAIRDALSGQEPKLIEVLVAEEEI